MSDSTLRLAFLFVIGIFLWFGPLWATEPLDCESPSYLVRIVLGSDNFVGNVILYETKKNYAPNEVPTVATKVHEVKWRKSVILEGPSDAPPFRVKVKGNSGWIEYQSKRERITCDWFD